MRGKMAGATAPDTMTAALRTPTRASWKDLPLLRQALQFGLALGAYWQRRRTAQTLRSLSDAQLRDIGLDRSQIDALVYSGHSPERVRKRPQE